MPTYPNFKPQSKILVGTCQQCGKLKTHYCRAEGLVVQDQINELKLKCVC